MFRNRIARGNRKTLLALGASALALSVIVPIGAFASHPEVSLPGSDFEIDTDANLKVDDAGSIDWASVQETRKTEAFTGSQDESFGQGTKEDTAVPSIVDGGIPPNKSDLKSFGVYQEGATSSGFLHMFWSRVQDPSGTTNMDFEFNQNTAAPGQGNGVTPLRTAGDLLITYDLSKGGTHPVLSLRTWSGTAWGPADDLTTSGKATGSINTSPVPAAQSDGLGDLDPRTFGEASIDLSEILPTDQCATFASVYLKSRASDSFTSALKDFVPPLAKTISNCGSITIHKVDDSGNPLQGAVFTLFVDNAPLDGPPPHGTEDTMTSKTCTTDASGNCTISNVLQGQYWVVETTTPPNHQQAADQNVIVAAGVDVPLTFINPRNAGAIKITKTRKHAASGSGDHPHAGVDFTVNGVTKTTDANGVACFDGLLFGSYPVHEVTPAGYQGEADKTVTVDNNARCSDNPFVGETVSFSNTPLTNITVSVDSQVDGGTASTITCTGKAPAQTDTNGDGSVSLSNLSPGTYVCEVVVDP